MSDQEFEGKLMGGKIKIVLYDIPQEISALLFEEVYKEALRLEKIFNFFKRFF